MFAVEVRDHIMIAHSLKGAVFGPAQKLHGATFVVDVAFMRETLTEDNIVVDMGRAHEALKQILEPLNYANLDDVFPGDVTTTEYLCRHIHTQIARAAHDGRLGPGSDGLVALRVTLNESHVAKAWYEAPV